MTKPLDPIEPITATMSHDGPHPDNCENCKTTLQGSYCHVCGQHGHNPLKSFRHALEDVFESFWHVDGRIFRTLRDLLLPWRVINNYLAGQRVRYIPPLRIFVILSLVTFFVAHFAIHSETGAVRFNGQDTDSIAAATTVEDVQRLRDKALAGIDKGAADKDNPAFVAGVMAAARDAVQAQANARIHDLEDAKAKGLPVPPPTTIVVDVPESHSDNSGDWNVTTKPVQVSWLPGFANNALNAAVQRGAKNAKRFARDRSALFQAWVGSIPTALFFMVPVFALLLRILYLFTPWTYLEHLVVALYSHAFLLLGSLLCFLLSLTLRAVLTAGAVNTMITLVILAMMTILLWTQKRVYQQGWMLTLVKYFTIGSIYWFLLGFGALFALLLVFLK
ncbi:DUF3667 domain-containing protein [Solilutibacter silvestris]|uniref:DUF3667 domain-containing protein n=1 Tax=Solilutibacter silvestris TaxID=1645665 RepID=A0A2K1Q0H6_9GAMM|nr:DUF3667 domain-containing protein [Lysobacter silvestris]PNS08533.1 hypothetical protein Lysil_0162 [Lysobacter silvestris]